MNLTIEPGTRDDYAALARFHYRAPRPATPVLTLRATEGGTLAGVLVVAMPTLNAPWRQSVWPELFTKGLQQRHAASLVNRHVRTIARVVVDPRYRALGIARRLVSHYLASPLTTHTEAVAAMGRCCPFFARAGMREVDPPPTRRDRRLALALRQCSLEAWELVELSRARSCLEASPLLRHEVWRWAIDSKSTRRHLPDSPADCEALTEFAVLAGSSLTARPVVYVSHAQAASHTGS